MSHTTTTRPEAELPPSHETAFALLRAGVPLTLLLDLAAPVHSDELLREEPADTTWVPHAVA